MRLKKLLPKQIINSLWHWPRAFLSALVFDFPAREFTVIGVCGTKGKTTTTYLINKILLEAGLKTAMFSTAAVSIADKELSNKMKMTTPDSWQLNKFLKQADKSGCRYLVIEISSHAIKQHRILGIPVKYLVITNLSPDHLEYHKNAGDYIKTHELFANSKTIKKVFINSDDIHSKDLDIKNPIAKYGLDNDLTRQLKNLTLPLIGKFNLYNALASASVSLEMGIDWTMISKTLIKTDNIPGRMEFIKNDFGFTVIVDYAHSIESLNNLFEAIGDIPHKRIISVFGACGERDPSKRPIMGEILNKNSDIFIATNDDPYGEDPEQIASQLLKNTNNYQEKCVLKVLDRKSAIDKAIRLAQKGDVVLILGKGAEQFQVFKNKKIPWDDRIIVKEILAAI